ncbi:nuclease-like protein [Melghiribacillus thermohalophilus]|uniref:Nuclease-like protein n=1 Tax=Melghiribacillus thermohalophilus TaxID=1324956 RepID=A0A4R3NGM0_9BACI|nr:nuclease-related domain-containing protein [Melghiribacillus thermohalophilus]TCT26443.1 nuclease-like protein [Melghiribacillus thermohalophilus]
MILLPRTKPHTLPQLESLLPRLDPKDSIYPVLKNIKHRLESGYAGEKSLDYFYEILDLQPFPILHNLRLKNNDKYFQIDTLILFNNFFLIIEVKNYSGIIRYNPDSSLLVREGDNGKLERFSDPFIQAQIQRNHLASFLRKHNLPAIPIHTLIVFSHQAAILEFSRHIPDMIVSQKLLDRVPELRKQYGSKIYSNQQLVTIGKLLAGASEPQKDRVIDIYSISHNRIKNGVWCTGCRNEMMVRERRNWLCPICFHRDRKAHIPALQDYKWIFGPEITNEKARTFLGVPSRWIIKNLLKRSGLTQIGVKSKTKYIIP